MLALLRFAFMRQPRVLTGRHLFQVSGVDAARVFAPMMQVQAVDVAASQPSIDHTMRGSATAQPIAVIRERPLPIPAPGSFVNDVRRADVLDGVMPLDEPLGMPLQDTVLSVGLFGDRRRFSAPTHTKTGRVRRLWQWTASRDVGATLGAMQLPESARSNQTRLSASGACTHDSSCSALRRTKSTFAGQRLLDCEYGAAGRTSHWDLPGVLFCRVSARTGSASAHKRSTGNRTATVYASSDSLRVRHFLTSLTGRGVRRAGDVPPSPGFSLPKLYQEGVS